MPKFKVINQDLTVSIPSGTELIDAAKKHPDLGLKFGCTRGDCGVCAIEVVSGNENLSQQSAQEKETLRKKGLGEGWRLACQCAINGDVIARTLCENT